MHTVIPDKNCHEYCQYKKQCRYHPGYVGQDPEECAMFYKIEDLIAEAKDIEMEQKKAYKEVGIYDDGDW